MITLYFPIYPYNPIQIKPGIMRRLQLRSSPFATYGEIWKAHEARPPKRKHRV